MTQETIREQFLRMDGERQERIRSSEQYAYYTIPSIFPRDENGDNNQGVGMLDSIGSAVANHFANKLVTTLFSPNRPFFRLEPEAGSETAQQLDELVASGQADEANKILTQWRATASKIEKDAVEYLEKISYRTAAVEAAKLLVVTGDTVIKNPGDGRKPTTYNMKNYVCLKDGSGMDKVLIMRDSRAFAAFTDAEQDLIREANKDKDKAYDATTDVIVYTKYELQADGRYKMTQATDDLDLIDNSRMYPKEKMPHTHLSWNLNAGENYGRGLVEDFAGSFHIIDANSRTVAMLNARIAAQKILVSPQSNIDVEELNSSDSQTYISGDPTAIGTEKLVDYQDIVALEEVIARHTRQISSAFLYSAGSTRDAERVTAEEIRENAAELEIAHGGVYSRFSSDWQRKAAVEAVAGVEGSMPRDVDTQIVTGMDSLSRTGEMQSVRLWVQDLSLMNQIPEAMQAVIDMQAFAEYAAVQRGIEQGAFVKSADRIKQEQADAQAEQQRIAEQEQSARMQEATMKQGMT